MQLDRDAAVAAVQRLADRARPAACSRRRRGSSRSRTRTCRARSARGRSRRATIRASSRSSPSAAAARLQAAEVADSLGIPEVIVPPYPGITSAMGLLTSDLKYDQMRTVFMIEGAIDARAARPRARRSGRRAARAPARRRRRPPTRSRSWRGLDCRYVGQGYELRVPLAGGAVHAGGARGVPPPARAGVRPCVPRPDRDRQPARDRLRQAARASSGCRSRADGGDPLLGEGESVFRGRRTGRYATRYYERSRLPLGEPFDGPGGRLPARHDHRRPAGLDRARRRIRQPYPHADERRPATPPASTRSPRR